MSWSKDDLRQIWEPDYLEDDAEDDDGCVDPYDAALDTELEAQFDRGERF